MNRNSLLTKLSVLTLAILIGTTPARADQASDREEIKALMWRYARALDTFNPEAYAAVYTPDGQFGTGANATKGTEALKKMIVGVKDGREKRKAEGQEVPPMYHMTTDTWIEFIDDTHARHHNYWLTIFGAAGKGTKSSVEAAGHGIDDVVKVNGKWLIKVRDTAVKD